jgi:hypothetical protein
MTRQDLIDVAYEAISNVHDMDTTLTDFARAAVDALLPFMKTVDEPMKYACECGGIALDAKGYKGGSVSFFADFSGTGRPWIASYYLGKRGTYKSKSIHAETFSDAVAAISAEIEGLPAVWTDEQVAATLGIAA